MAKFFIRGFKLLMYNGLEIKCTSVYNNVVIILHAPPVKSSP